MKDWLVSSASFSNPVCISYHETIRKGKLVLEVYGEDVPDDFKQLLEMVR